MWTSLKIFILEVMINFTFKNNLNLNRRIKGFYLFIYFYFLLSIYSKSDSFKKYLEMVTDEYILYSFYSYILVSFRVFLVYK